MRVPRTPWCGKDDHAADDAGVGRLLIDGQFAARDPLDRDPEQSRFALVPRSALAVMTACYSQFVPEWRA